MTSAIISAVAAIVVAIIEGISLSERQKEKKANERREKLATQRAEENALSMKMNFATLQLSVVCSNALTGGHNNGNVERAKLAAQEAESEYRAYLQKIAASQISKV